MTTYTQFHDKESNIDILSFRSILTLSIPIILVLSLMLNVNQYVGTHNSKSTQVQRIKIRTKISRPISEPTTSTEPQTFSSSRIQNSSVIRSDLEKLKSLKPELNTRLGSQKSVYSGHWVKKPDYAEKYAKMREIYDLYRSTNWDIAKIPLVRTPVSSLALSRLDNETCGNSKKIKNYYGLYCNPNLETSCCSNFADSKSAKCVNKKDCSDHSLELDLDTSEYLDAESADWFVDDSKFNVFSSEQFKNKLSGKTVYLIGDSHSRTMYATLVGVLAGFDYDWADPNSCKGHWEWLYAKTCRLTLEVEHSVYEDTENKILIKLLTVYDQHSFLNAMKSLNPEPDSILVFEQGQHQDYVSKDIERMIRGLDIVWSGLSNINSKKFFMFPPESSYNKAPRHRWIGSRKLGQNNKRLWKFNVEVVEFLEENYDDWLVLNLTALTRKVVSCDGSHYGFQVFKTILTVFLEDL